MHYSGTLWSYWGAEPISVVRRASGYTLYFEPFWCETCPQCAQAVLRADLTGSIAWSMTLHPAVRRDMTIASIVLNPVVATRYNPCGCHAGQNWGNP
jgi:hypothetical protein